MAGGKQPWYIHPANSHYLALAGVWDRWTYGGEVVESCAVIVTEPNALMKSLHDRMPVILPEQDWEAWLDPRNQNVANLQAMLQPCANDEIAAHRVSSRQQLEE